MAGNQLAPAEFPSQEQPESAPSSADFYLISSEATGQIEQLEEAKVDEITGLPLPIYYGPEHQNMQKDFHHGWHSQWRIKRIYPHVVAMALRASRGYEVPKAFHGKEFVRGFHARIPGSVELPPTDSVFEKVALGLAGVVPRQAYDLRSLEGYEVVELNDTQHEFLADPRRTFIENTYKNPLCRDNSREALSTFMIYSAVGKLLEENQAALDLTEVLNQPEILLRRQLGRIMYKGAVEAIEDALEPVREVFETARDLNMLADRNASLSRAVLEFMPEARFATLLPIAVWHQVNDSTLQTGVNRVELQAA